jgi:5S rRNA maturation endonuclease (ribonuclease M5)
VNVDPRTEYILSQLKHLPPRFGTVWRGNRLFIRCPRHSGGNEQTPSLGIITDPARGSPGVFNCLACGFRGVWKTLADEIGLSGLPSDLEHRIYPLQLPHENALLAKPLIMPRGVPWSAQTPWRSINGRLISELGGVRLFANTPRERLILPCHVNNTLNGWVSCSLDGSDPKYLNMADDGRGWVLHTLFPYDHIRQRWWSKPIFLVEGWRDALNLIQYGVPALAVCGTRTWSKFKRTILLALNCPAVFIILDPDEAGELAAKAIEANLRGFIKAIRIQLPASVDKNKKLDPGALNSRQIAALAAMTQQRLAT